MDTKKKLFLVFVATIVITLAGTAKIFMGDLGQEAEVVRPENGATEVDLSANVGGVEYDMNLKVAARKYTDEEAIENFSKCKEMIMCAVFKDDPNNNQVKDNVELLKSLDEYGVTVDWFSSNYKLIDSDGNVYNDDFKYGQKEKCTLTAKIKYENLNDTFGIDIEVIEKDLSQEERAQKNLLMAAAEADKNNIYDSKYNLPDEIDGEKISYKKKVDYSAVFILPILGIAAGAVIVLGEKNKKIQNEKNRKDELLLDYAEVVSKLTLLAGAGMSIRGAWEKIVLDYKNKLKNGEVSKRAAYDEMEIAYNGMKSGKSESYVYSAFGSRCNTREYMKLGTILGQNVRKGSKDVLKMLETEAENAFENRKNQAVKMGEKAGTKLLLPMIMMLMVVMAVVMIPAIMTLNF